MAVRGDPGARVQPAALSSLLSRAPAFTQAQGYGGWGEQASSQSTRLTSGCEQAPSRESTGGPCGQELYRLPVSQRARVRDC